MINDSDSLREMTDNALLQMIGNYIKYNRLQQNISQDVIATEAGISRSTLSLLERGEKVKTDTLIKILRVLNLLPILHVFKVEEQISPLDYAKIKKKERKHAASAKKTNKIDEEDIGW